MSLVDFSTIEENKFIAVKDFDIRIYIDNQIHYESSDFYDAFTVEQYQFNLALFSYDSQHVICTSDNNTLLNIISYNNLLLHKYDLFTFTFKTVAQQIIKYAVSPNKNQVAILFNMTNNCYYSFGNSDIIQIENPNENDELVQFLHVYDFTPNTGGRLLFNKQVFDENTEFSFSEYNSIAVTGTFNVDGNDYGLNIFDLETGKLILYDSQPGSIDIVCFFPLSDADDTRKILLISYDQQTYLNNVTVKLIDNLETLEELSILEGIYINSAYIKKNGEITLCTVDGLYFFNFNERPRNTRLFQGYDIESVSYSISGDFIGVYIIESDTKEYFKLYDLENPHEFMIYEDDYNSRLSINYYDNDSIDYEDDEDDEDDHTLEYIDPELCDCVIPETNQHKLDEFGSHTCYDVINLSEENIGNYLRSDKNNIVLFYKQPSDEGFLATCLTFTTLRTYLRDPIMLFYRCIDEKDYTTYHTNKPDFLKIPTQGGNIFVNYSDMKQKYIQRQNMIFLELEEQVEKTISYDASYNMNFVSSNHCQNGSVIVLYRIIF